MIHTQTLLQRSLLSVFAFTLLVCSVPRLALAEKKEGVVLSNKFDDALTLRTVSLLPSTDNVDGIFSRPIDKKLHDLLEADHQWQFIDSQFSGGLVAPSELIRNPQKVMRLGASLKVDGVMVAEVRKNPKDFVLALYLFGTRDGLLISHLAATDLDQSSIDKAMKQLADLYQQLKYRIPYDGLVLSRVKNRVTVNLGQVDGIVPGQELVVSQIIEVVRHPKLSYIIQHEKAVIGKVRLVKVDPHLSFGDIITETEAGAIQKNAKITGARPVKYTPENWINKDYMPVELLLSENNQVNGKVQEWRPEFPPTFGQVGVSLGLGRYQQNLSLANGTSLTTKSNLYPTVNLFGELWINPEWYVSAQITQGTGGLDNPVAGGQPTDLSSTLGIYALDFGYNLLLKDDFFDSKLFFALGFMSYKMSLDNSNPEGLTSSEYSGLRLTLGGKTPFDERNKWYAGGALYWYINPSFREKPVSSGGDDNNVVHFSFMLDHRWSERLWINSSLNFQTLMTDFSGGGTRTTPATKVSQRSNSLLLGVSYMF